MTCNQFRTTIAGDVLQSSFAQREAAKEHFDNCQHCQEYCATFEEVEVSPEIAAIADTIRREDEKKTKHPMSEKQKKIYGDQ